MVDASGAPPADIAGNEGTEHRGVGAHQVHLAGGSYSVGFPCRTCHVVPDSLYAAGHIDSTEHAEVTFGGLAVQDGATPEWNGSSCQNVYCHGNFEFGQRQNAPVWTQVNGTQAQCGSCHALPPTGGHPASEVCQLCHSTIVGSDQQIIDKAGHVNGGAALGAPGDHDSERFPINSGHHQGAWQGCSACHLNPANFEDVSCLNCHQHEQSAMNTTHAGITGYAYVSRNCLTCHPNGDRADARFPEHDNLHFPIYSGNHANMWSECAICHVNPQRRSDVSCFACHGQGGIDNIHAGITGYNYDSSACIGCHPSGDKSDARFPEHDNLHFPIYSGNHANMWSECAICHVNPQRRSDVSCFACHGQGGIDSIHAGIMGYRYENGACIGCHPNGEKSDAMFPQHDDLHFPIYSHTHKARWDGCARCHPDPTNRQNFSCFGCHIHNQTDVEANHKGRRGFVYDSRKCLICHPLGEKEPFTAHDVLYFPIFSGRHKFVWLNDCNICHADPDERALFFCTNCHKHVESRMALEHQNVPGYVYENTACYACHPDGTG